MRGRYWLWMSVVGLMMVLTGQGMLMGQERGPQQRDGRGERRQFDPEAMRERMMQMMQQRLEAGDEEWAVIRPRLEKVNELLRDGRGGFARFGRRPGSAEGDQDQPASELDQKRQALATLLEQEQASSEQIREAMAQLRTAQQKREQALKQARESLREVLTLKQEAILLNSGVLD